MWTCLHNNILVLDRDCGALHWWSLAIRYSVESASEPRGIKLKDAFIHISNFRGRNHHGLQKNDTSNELLQSGGRLYLPNNCYVNNVYLWKIDIFSHKFYLNLYMYEILTLTIICLGGWTVLYTTVFTAPKYGFKVWICRWGQSRVILPSSLQSYNGIF